VPISSLSKNKGNNHLFEKETKKLEMINENNFLSPTESMAIPLQNIEDTTSMEINNTSTGTPVSQMKKIKINFNEISEK